MRSGSLLSVLITAIQSLSVSLLYSDLTPFSILHTSILVEVQPFYITPVRIVAAEQIAVMQEKVVLDYLYEEGLSAVARRGREQGSYWRMWGAEDTEEYGSVFSSYLRVLNLSRVFLVGDTIQAVRVAELYRADPILYRDFAVVPTDLNLDFALQFVGKQIKPRGVNQLPCSSVLKRLLASSKPWKQRS